MNLPHNTLPYAHHGDMAAIFSNDTNPFDDPQNGKYAPFFGTLGATIAMAMAGAGSAYGTAVAGSAVAQMAVVRPDLVMRALIPVVMAGIVAIYGLVTAVIISNGVEYVKGDGKYTIHTGFGQFTGGLVCGACGLATGYAIGEVGRVGVMAMALQERIFVGLVLILIFAEVLGLYGLITSLIIVSV